MTDRRTLTVVLWGLVAVALILVLGFRYLSPGIQNTLADRLGRGDYHLTMTDGQPFTEATLQGAPSAVFFGFTHCPEVCPTTLGEIAQWQEELQKDGTPLRVFFVTVDPERDTVDSLREYVSWVPGVTGVSGAPSEIAKAIKSFGVYAAKVPLDGGGYTMDHSANVMLFDRQGRLFEPIGYQEDFDRAIGKIRRLVAQ